MYIHIYIYIYIYIYTYHDAYIVLVYALLPYAVMQHKHDIIIGMIVSMRMHQSAADLRAKFKVLYSRGFDSSRILVLRDGILMSVGKFQKTLSQRILVGAISVSQ